MGLREGSGVLWGTVLGQGAGQEEWFRLKTVGEKDGDTHPNYPGKRREILNPNASHEFKLVTQSQA